MVKLKDNEISWINNGEGCNWGKAECAGIFNLVKVAEEVLRGIICGRNLSYKILIIAPKILTKDP
jgi:hypothetical protein